MKKHLLTTILILFAATLFAAARPAEISGTLSFLNTGDTVQVELNKYPNLPFGSHLYETRNLNVVNHSFHLEFDAPDPFIYISVTFKGKSAAPLQHYIMPAGGQVTMSDHQGRYQFTGSSARGFEIQRDIRDAMSSQRAAIKFTPENLDRYCAAQDQAIARGMQVLSSGRQQISRDLYSQLQANIIFGVNRGKYLYLRIYGHTEADSVHRAFEKSYMAYQEHHKAAVWDTLAIPHQDKLRSPFYVNYVFEKYYADSCFVTGRPFSEHRFLDYVSRNFTGELRERLAVYLFLSRSNKSKDNLQADLDQLLETLSNPDFRPKLTEIRDNNFSDRVRDFVLTDTNNRQVKLSMFRGKVVVLDFYYTGCGNCLKLAPVLHQVEEEFKKKDVVFLSISIDKNRATWMASVKSQLYSSPLSVNLYTSGNGTEDPMIRGFNISGYPTLLLIDKHGKLGKNSNDPRSDAGKDLRQHIAAYLAR